ncbi:MAG: ACP S-malonyltransferase [Clostridium sp.]|jgi:[acyl-carrier-protein] S-malonyltransferase|nr:ACP S-malonyltransferase [Clostridium sp.]
MGTIGFLFPGQGTQHIGMGEMLCKEYRIADETFEEAGEYLNLDLKKMCFEGSLTNLNQLEHMFCAILTCSVASFRVYMERIGIPPKLTAGHSLGEYSALVCADAMRLEDALRLVKFRGSIAQELADAGNSWMAVVNGTEEASLRAACQKACQKGNYVAISCYNSERQYTVSGHGAAVTQVQDQLADTGGELTPLFMSAPFHSDLMKAAADLLEEELSRYRYRKLRWPVVSNVRAVPYESEEDLVRSLKLQLIKPVRWMESVRYMEAQGCDFFLEMGPQAILSNLMNAHERRVAVYSFGQKDDREDVIRRLTGGLKEFIGSCLAIAVSTRNTNWDEAEYQAGVVRPYEKIEAIQKELDETGKLPERGQMLEAWNLLKTILQTKRVPPEEQEERFQELFDVTNTGTLFTDMAERPI